MLLTMWRSPTALPTGRRFGIRGLLAAVSLASCPLACAAVLGLDDVMYQEEGAAPVDGSAADGSAADGSATDGGFADTREASDATFSCDADLASDPSNCGRCGHGCLGSTCVASACRPVTLAPSNLPLRIALGPGALYWTGGTAFEDIYVCSPADCSAGPKRLVHEIAMVHELAVGPAFIYWSTDYRPGYVRACPHSDCADASFELAMVDDVYALAADDGGVYFGSSNPKSVRWCPSGTCDGGHVVPTLDGSSPLRLALDQRNVYVGTYDSVNASSKNDAGVRSLLPSSAVAFATGAGALYAVTQTGTLWQCPSVGGACVQAASALGTVRSMAADDDGLYFAVGGEGIKTCDPRRCGETKALLTADGDTTGVAIDGSYVYWTSMAAVDAGGAVRRVAR